MELGAGEAAAHGEQTIGTHARRKSEDGEHAAEEGVEEGTAAHVGDEETEAGDAPGFVEVAEDVVVGVEVVGHLGGDDEVEGGVAKGQGGGGAGDVEGPAVDLEGHGVHVEAGDGPGPAVVGGERFHLAGEPGIAGAEVEDGEAAAVVAAEPADEEPGVRVVGEEEAVDAGKLAVAGGDFLAGARRVVEIFWFYGAFTQHDARPTMNDKPTQGKPARQDLLLKILRRLFFLVLLGLAFGWATHQAAGALERRAAPAGFVQGVLQGALMPIALPNLAFGNDVSIYALQNTGRTYKLGYTVGVNACGLVFFGFFFWRVRRVMKARMQK